MTGQQLQPRPPVQPETAGHVTLVNPKTGEVVPLHGETSDLAAVIDGIREWEAVARYAKRLIADELHTRMDRDLTLTLHADGFTVKGQGAMETVYDAEGLWNALDRLVADGTISEHARDEAVQMAVTYTVKAQGVRKLKSAGHEALVDEHSEKRPRDARRITLSRRGQ